MSRQWFERARGLCSDEANHFGASRVRNIGKVVRWRPEVAVYPKYGTDAAARAHGARLVANGNIAARIAEIMAVAAERAEVTAEEVIREPKARAEVTAEEVIRELKALGFSDIGKVVRWRPEVVYEEVESEDEPDKPARQVMVSRVMVVDSATLSADVRIAVAEVSQNVSGGIRVKMHDKHAALVSLGRHLGLFTDHVKLDAVYGISEEPMSAEEWKKQFVKPG
jgi:phage terminase small subunit